MVVTRFGHDGMGDMLVPASALYGPQTARAVEKLPISKLRYPRSFLKALALIKAKASRVNRLAGAYPDDDVNRSQCSNDIIPTALNLAAISQVTGQLLPAMSVLSSALNAKAAEFGQAVKMGLSHQHDALPMRLGQDFSAYARQVELAGERIEAALTGMYELPIGGTAEGTGLNAPPGFAHDLVAELASYTGYPFREASNRFEAQAAKDAAVFLSASLRNYAVALTKIANEFHCLGWGPSGVLMVCAQIVGYDSAIAWSGAAGDFELNTVMPLIACNLIDSIELLAAATRNFEARMLGGMTATEEHSAEVVEHSLAMVTALVPVVGYDRAAEIAQRASVEGRTIRSVAAELSGLSGEELRKLLDPLTQSSAP